MVKITLLGAGSTIFAKNLIGDILSFPEFAQATISLHDIDEERLRTTSKIANRLARKIEVNPKIETHLDRRASLDGADYAIAMFQVGGYYPGTVIDFEVPKKYNLRQTIGDTLGIGGIFRALRTIPVFLDMCKDMKELCPKVTLLNYVNPMAMNTWAINQSTSINTVGLCHSVQGTAKQLAEDINVPIEEINYLAAGINHMAFYLKFEQNGKDLYPEIFKVIKENRVPNWNLVRYKVLEYFGYFVTESSEHFSEYVPWFIKDGRSDLIEDYNIPLDEYIRRCKVQIAGWEVTKESIENPDKFVDEEELKRKLSEVGAVDWDSEMVVDMVENIDMVDRTHEYGSYIIHSLETGTPRVIYGNVMNSGLIENLPNNSCVEVPILVDKNGLQPTKIGMLPPQLTALMQTNINVQALTVEAALTGRRDHIYHAAMLDPHTAAELSIDQIVSLVDDLIKAHGDWLPTYHG